LPGRDIPGDKPERLERARPIGHLEISLDTVVVGAEERRKSSCVARAPEVLHQECVEKRRTEFWLQAQDVGQSHPDQARADGVARSLPLGQVEGVRQTGQHLRQM